MGTANLVISCVCEAKPQNVEGTHHSLGWLGRVPKEDVPAVVRFLRSQGIKPRVIYRDKSTDRKKKYARGRFYKAGWAHKVDATHADMYDPGPSGREADSTEYLKLRNETARLTAIRAALSGRKTKDPDLLDILARKPEWAYAYAKNALKGRFHEAEETIAKSEYKNQYLKAFPDAIDDWALLGWTDWMDVP